MEKPSVRTTTIGEGSHGWRFEIRSDDPGEIETYRQAVMSAVQALKKVREPAPCRGCGKD